MTRRLTWPHAALTLVLLVAIVAAAAGGSLTPSQQLAQPLPLSLPADAHPYQPRPQDIAHAPDAVGMIDATGE
jgi:hypothetical protein